MWSRACTMSVCVRSGVHTCDCRCPIKYVCLDTRGVRISGVTSSCELPNMGTGNGTLVHCKNIRCISPLRNFSISSLRIIIGSLFSFSEGMRLVHSNGMPFLCLTHSEWLLFYITKLASVRSPSVPMWSRPQCTSCMHFYSRGCVVFSHMSQNVGEE